MLHWRQISDNHWLRLYWRAPDASAIARFIRKMHLTSPASHCRLLGASRKTSSDHGSATFDALACPGAYCLAAVDSLAGSSDALFTSAAPLSARNLVWRAALLHGQRTEALCKTRCYPSTRPASGMIPTFRAVGCTGEAKAQMHGLEKWAFGILALASEYLSRSPQRGQHLGTAGAVPNANHEAEMVLLLSFWHGGINETF